MLRVGITLGFGLSFAFLALGCKSRASEQDTRAASDAASMPLNVRAELQALCEAAAGVADPSLRASCATSEAPRDGAKEEVVLRLRDDEGGVFLYYATRVAYDGAIARDDAGHADPTASCAKLRSVWRLGRTKVPAAMTAPALTAVNAACDRAPAIP